MAVALGMPETSPNHENEAASGDVSSPAPGERQQGDDAAVEYTNKAMQIATRLLERESSETSGSWLDALFKRCVVWDGGDADKASELAAPSMSATAASRPPIAIDPDQCPLCRRGARSADSLGQPQRSVEELWVADARPNKIAVVDDDRAVCDSLKFFLEVMGCVVETFLSAASFLSTDLREIGRLILDHHMPQMTGLELAEKLRADNVSLPILLITGSPSRDIVARASALGIRVLDKPPSEEDLLDFINQP